MPNVVATLEPPRSGDKSLKDYAVSLKKIYEQLARVVNGRLSLGDGATPDNIAGAWANAVTPPAPDTQFVLTHNLGRIPVGWLSVYQNKAASLYDSGTPWTATQIFLKCDIATVHVKVFIL